MNNLGKGDDQTAVSWMNLKSRKRTGESSPHCSFDSQVYSLWWLTLYERFLKYYLFGETITVLGLLEKVSLGYWIPGPTEYKPFLPNTQWWKLTQFHKHCVWKKIWWIISNIIIIMYNETHLTIHLQNWMISLPYPLRLKMEVTCSSRMSVHGVTSQATATHLLGQPWICLFPFFSFFMPTASKMAQLVVLLVLRVWISERIANILNEVFLVLLSTSRQVPR